MPTPRKLALKRLTHSDLTFFKRYYDTSEGSKQKGINLNLDVLEALYTNFPATGTIVVQLFIQGPGSSVPQQVLTRKIVKSASARNWRLNGEIVHDPEGGDVDRYAILQPDDLALMEFFDDGAGLPTRVNLLLISQVATDDAAPYGTLNAFLGAKSMVALTANALSEAVAGTMPDSHPIESFLLTDDLALELLAEGVAVDLAPEDAPEPTPDPSAAFAPSRRRKRTFMPFDYNKVITPSTKRVTAEAFDKVKKAQAVNGQAGEELVNDYFAAHPELGTFEWSSRTISTTSLYDFRRTDITNGEYIDVKTTSESFDAAFNMSIFEIRQAAQSPGHYYIYRVYDIGDQPRMRISGDISALAKKIMAQCDTAFRTGLAPGVFSILPEFLADELNFGDEITLPIDED